MCEAVKTIVGVDAGGRPFTRTHKCPFPSVPGSDLCYLDGKYESGLCTPNVSSREGVRIVKVETPRGVAWEED